jgi:hypothetical protein
MRDYINSGLVGAALFFTVALAGFGAVLGLFGGMTRRTSTVR